MKVYVKNMACESCKVVIKEVMAELDIHVLKIELGEIETREDISSDDRKNINSRIRKAGLQLLESKEGRLLEKIRKIIYEYVYQSDEKPNLKFSVLLSSKLNHSYGYLSNYFSEIEAISIEQYIISLKVERVKEMILFGEFTLSETAYKLHYSSVAHLSNQFKKITGLSPTHFKNLMNIRRKTIQEL
jgi:AraC-like DNA-binding protein